MKEDERLRQLDEHYIQNLGVQQSTLGKSLPKFIDIGGAIVRRLNITALHDLSNVKRDADFPPANGQTCIQITYTGSSGDKNLFCYGTRPYLEIKAELMGEEIK